jgi:hypothetical protein
MMALAMTSRDSVPEVIEVPDPAPAAGDPAALVATLRPEVIVGSSVTLDQGTDALSAFSGGTLGKVVVSAGAG